MNKLFCFLLIIATTSAGAQTPRPVSSLPNASSPLGDADYLALIQGGHYTKATIGQLKTNIPAAWKDSSGILYPANGGDNVEIPAALSVGGQFNVLNTTTGGTFQGFVQIQTKSQKIATAIQDSSTGTQASMTLGSIHDLSLPFGSYLIGMDPDSNILYGVFVTKDSAQLMSANGSLINEYGACGTHWYSTYMDVSYNNGAKLNSLTIDSIGAHWEYNNANVGSLPNQDGTTGQVLTTNGSGLWSFQNTASVGWGLTGNANTTPGSNFIGTSDDKNLVFKVFNNNAGLLDYNNANTLFGIQQTNALSTGESNCSYGAYTLNQLQTGSFNTAIGSISMNRLTSGSDNTAIGYSSLYLNQNGGFNVAVGYSTLSSDTGNENTAIGSNALISELNGTLNTALGYNADVIIPAGLTQATAIGAKALVGKSYSNVFGDTTQSNYYNGFGTSYPEAVIDIRTNTTGESAIRIVDGTQGNGKVLTSDANGEARWAQASSGASGYYIPAITDSTSSLTFNTDSAYWYQNGNSVTVTGLFYVNGTPPSSDVIYIPLPINSTFLRRGLCIGAIALEADGAVPITGTPSNTAGAYMNGIFLPFSNVTGTFSFTYLIR